MGLVGPKMVTRGLLRAAAMCMGPESLAMTKLARSRRATSWGRLVLPERDWALGILLARSMVSGPPATTERRLKCFSIGFTSASKFSTGQRLVSQFAPGIRTA